MRRKQAPSGSAVDELQGIDLGDARLEARLRRMVAALEADPAAGFPTAVGTVAEREASYRLLRNERVELSKVMAPHAAQTVLRAKALGTRPLVVIDKTSFVFSGEADRAGLDRLGVDRQGFDAFFALAVAHDRTPLGVVAISPREAGRGRSGADDWDATIEDAANHIEALDPVYVMDREADAYALFATLLARGRDFVVRVSHDRWAREHEDAAPALLRTIAERTRVQLRRTVRLSRRSGVGKAPDARRRHPPREGREAVLSVRACSVVLPKPRKLGGELPSSVTVNLIQVIEEKPPKDAAAVDWLLCTTLPADDAASIAAVVDAYRARWTIEEYFKALKSGCAYEKRQLESRRTLLTALGILAPLAWRLLTLRSLADDDISPASTVLDADELHVLRKISVDIKLGPSPKASEALLALARLGGHFPQNGRPGWLVIWRGFQKLVDRVAGYRLARAEK